MPHDRLIFAAIESDVQARPVLEGLCCFSPKCFEFLLYAFHHGDYQVHVPQPCCVDALFFPLHMHMCMACQNGWPKRSGYLTHLHSDKNIQMNMISMYLVYLEDDNWWCECSFIGQLYQQ